MASSFDGNCSSYWSYSPYPYCNSYDTSSSNSSYFDSPTSSSSPRMMMFPVYDQPQPCYYYADPIPPPCQQFVQLSPPIAPSPQVKFLCIYIFHFNLFCRFPMFHQHHLQFLVLQTIFLIDYNIPFVNDGYSMKYMNKFLILIVFKKMLSLIV
jgi:hypothetical protein